MAALFEDSLAQDLERIKSNREKRRLSLEADSLDPTQFRVTSDPDEVERLLDEIRRRRAERKLYSGDSTPTQATDIVANDKTSPTTQETKADVSHYNFASVRCVECALCDMCLVECALCGMRVCVNCDLDVSTHTRCLPVAFHCKLGTCARIHSRCFM